MKNAIATEDLAVPFENVSYMRKTSFLNVMGDNVYYECSVNDDDYHLVEKEDYENYINWLENKDKQEGKVYIDLNKTNPDMFYKKIGNDYINENDSFPLPTDEELPKEQPIPTMTDDEVEIFLKNRDFECTFYKGKKYISIYLGKYTDCYGEEEKEEITIRDNEFEFSVRGYYLTSKDMQTLIDLQSKYFKKRE